MVLSHLLKEAGKLVAGDAVQAIVKEGVKKGAVAGVAGVVGGGIKRAVEGGKDEPYKSCRVCGRRIRAATKVLKGRHKCKKCGHRTHNHCMGADGICKKCHEENR